MSNPILTKCYNSGGVIPIHTIVKFSASGTVVAAAASTDALIGVLRGVNFLGTTAAALGDRVDVIQEGIADVVVGIGGLTRGDKVTSDVNGAAVTWATGRTVGVALESGVAGDIVPVEVSPS
jgi:hypothetical protein